MAEEPSYIDYEAFLNPNFSPALFANSLVLSTNDAADPSLDLSTPLSRVLFDVQEIDTHIHTLTTRAALPLLTHTQDQVGSATRILREAEQQTVSLSQGYARLERDILRKWEAAEEARVAGQKSLETLRLCRAIARCLALGRQLEGQLAEAQQQGDSNIRVLERAAYTIASLRRLLSSSAEGEEGLEEKEEGRGLKRVKVMLTLRNDLVYPAETLVKNRAQQAVNRFSVSSSESGYKQVREARMRLVSAATTLYILSPPLHNYPNHQNSRTGHDSLLLSTLQGYLYAAISSSLAGLSRGLGMLSTLERMLAETSARCQDIVALEAILSTLRPPNRPLARGEEGEGEEEEEEEKPQSNLLQPLLQSLDTTSLPSYYWRSLASSLTTRVQDMVQRGGGTARALRANRERIKTEVRECVLRGSRMPAAGGLGGKKDVGVGKWEREAAVMVHAVVGGI